MLVAHSPIRARWCIGNLYDGYERRKRYQVAVAVVRVRRVTSKSQSKGTLCAECSSGRTLGMVMCDATRRVRVNKREKTKTRRVLTPTSLDLCTLIERREPPRNLFIGVNPVC